MKRYLSPVFEIIQFNEDDVIATSTVETGALEQRQRVGDSGWNDFFDPGGGKIEEVD